MSAEPQTEEPYRHLRIVNEEPGRYDAEERRRTPGGVAGGERHARIPFTVLSADLSPQAVVAYAWLQNHIGDDGCFPSFETLATEMRCSLRAAKARVAELEAARFLSHRQRGLGRSNVYDLHPEGDAPTPKPRRRNPEVQNSARQAREVQNSARPEVQSRVNRSAEFCTLTIPSNQTQLTKDSAPTERAAPGPKPAAKSAVTTAKAPTRTVEAKPTGTKNVPPSKRANGKAPPPSGDGFGLVGWLLKEQGGISRPEWQKVADAKAADAVIARLGGVEKAREHATARLLEPRRATLLWAHILEDEQRAEAARQRGVMERHLPRQAVSAADGFGAVARKARGEENDDQGRDGRTSTTTFDGVARPL